jgi:hypothetical protein
VPDLVLATGDPDLNYTLTTLGFNVEELYLGVREKNVEYHCYTTFPASLKGTQMCWSE